MHFQRTLNLLSRGSAPGYLAVFIGGFGDVVAGCLSRVEKRFPGFCREWRMPRPITTGTGAAAACSWTGAENCGGAGRAAPGMPRAAHRVDRAQLRRLLRGGSSQAPVCSGRSALPPDHRRRGAPAEKRAPGLRGMVGERLLAGRGRLHGRGAQDRRPLGALRRGGRQPGFFRLPARPGGPPLFPPEARSHAV